MGFTTGCFSFLTFTQSTPRGLRCVRQGDKPAVRRGYAPPPCTGLGIPIVIPSFEPLTAGFRALGMSMISMSNSMFI
jgi:hypothetical protein